jgi:UDP-N-acetylmuramyl tripeptide synthase
MARTLAVALMACLVFVAACRGGTPAKVIRIGVDLPLSGAEGRVAGRDFDIILDRRSAIRRAVEMARPGDTVLLAGKGHERSMLTADGREPWDERAVAEEAIRELSRS